MAAPMFGVIVAGRLVQTDFQEIDSTKLVINILDADNVNHIVIFLTGATPFPDGMGASVYFSWPDPTAAPSWQLLGFIANTKPSAIFKITKLKSASNGVTPFGTQPISHVAQIGLSIEPLQQLELQTPSVMSSANNMDTFMEFANKMLENFFNYLGSFAVTQSQMTPSSDMFVSLNTVQQWFTTFQRRLQQNPYFWRS